MHAVGQMCLWKRVLQSGHSNPSRCVASAFQDRAMIQLNTGLCRSLPAKRSSPGVAPSLCKVSSCQDDFQVQELSANHGLLVMRKKFISPVNKSDS